jgi:ribonuclease P/MRP protein subunit POP5
MPEPKMLPPALRSQKRYLIFEVLSEQPVKYEELANAVLGSAINFLGELGSSEAKIWMIQSLYDGELQRGAIKCSNNYVEQLRASLSLVSFVGETKVILRIIGVTGTIKSAKFKYLSKGLQKFA